MLNLPFRTACYLFLMLLPSIFSLGHAQTENDTGTFMPRAKVHQPINGNLRVVSTLIQGGEPFDGTQFSIWRERPDAYGKMQQTLMAQAGPQGQAEFELNPGRYRLQARNDTVVVEQTIDVPKTGALDTEINLNAGRLKLAAIMDETGMPAEAAWFRILRSDTDSYGRPTLVQIAGRGYAQSAEFLLPAGDYLAETRFGDTSTRMPVSIGAGIVTEQILQLDAGRLELTASLDGDGEPVDGVAYTITRLDQADAGPGLQIEGEAAASVAVILPHGDYLVTAQLDRASSTKEIRVTAGDSLNVDLSLNAGEVIVYATLAGQSDALLDSLFNVTPIGDIEASPESSARGPDHRARFLLPAGRHRAAATHGESAGEIEIDVEPGSSQTVAVDLDAGRINLQFLPQARHAAFPYTWFSVYRVEHDAQQRPRRRRVYNEGYFTSTDLVLPSGDYIVFTRSDQHQGEATFSVKPGSIDKIDVIANANAQESAVIERRPGIATHSNR